jgi:hypothetical protein
MSWFPEYLVSLVVLAVSCLPMLLLARRRRSFAMAAIFIAPVVLAGLRGWHAEARKLDRTRRDQRLEAELPHLGRRHDYVSSNQCRACHPAEHASWHSSFHRTMTQAGRRAGKRGRHFRRRDGHFAWASLPSDS